MIKNHLLSVQVLWIMFMMTLIIIIQQEKNVLIVLDDIIADIMANKIFQITIKELLIRCRKLNMSLVFIRQSYFSVPTDVRLNSTHCLIIKINSKRELQNIAM